MAIYTKAVATITHQKTFERKRPRNIATEHRSRLPKIFPPISRKCPERIKLSVSLVKVEKVLKPPQKPIVKKVFNTALA